MSRSLVLRNRQHVRALNGRRLRQLLQHLLRELLPVRDYDLAFYFVEADEMTRLNETFLRHRGSTDVITFDYSEPVPECGHPRFPVHGEIFVCIDEAIIQGRRFRTSWQAELTRYAIHGVLHLLGFDDHRTGERAKMKREEDRLLRRLSRGSSQLGTAPHPKRSAAAGRP